MKKIVLPLICMIFLVASVSALSWDNKLTEKGVTFDGKLISGNKLLEQYKPVEIKNFFGVGKTLFEGYLSQHTDSCGIDCSSTIEINLLENGVLIDDIIFKELNGDHITIDYKFYIVKNGKKILYELGKEVKAGTYQVILEGQKDFSQTIDWVILSQGEWIESWAWWRSFNDWNDDFETGTINSTFWTTTTNFGHSCDGSPPTATAIEQSGDDGYLELKGYGGTGSGGSYTQAMVRTNANYKTGYDYSFNFSLNGTLNDRDSIDITNGTVMTYQEAYLTDPVGTLFLYNFPSNATMNNYTLKLSSTGNASLYDSLGIIIATRDVSSLSAYYIQFRMGQSTGCDGDLSILDIFNFTSVLDKPLVTLNYPEVNGSAVTHTVFNCSGEVFGDVTLTNMSLWHNGTGTWSRNQTNDLTGTLNMTTFSKNFVKDDYILWTCEACQSDSLCAFSLENRTFEVPHIFTDSVTYNSHTYETASETFSINITANASLTDVKLIHDSIFYTPIISGTVYSSTFDIPNSVGNKTFYWDFTYAGTHINSTIYTQHVNNTLFGICNVTLTVPYINFTFMDEETLTNINATIDTSSWTYYLGDGTVTKSLLYSNTTAHNNYAFCLSASNDTMKSIRSIQYSSPGYPQRKYDASSDLTNATTNKTLYLLSSADGIYTTVQVVDEQGDKVSNVEVTMERQFSGVWTVVGQETTDSAGAVTFWVNPDYDHRLTFVSDDCTDTTVTIRPTQTQYTQQLQCGVGDEIYVTPIEGIKYSRTPVEGLILTGEHNFTFEVVSSKDNIVNISMEIVNASDGTVLASNWSSCSPGGCSIYVLYTVLSGADLKGRYYIDIGNGTFMIEGDAHWVNVLGPSAFDGKSGFRTFWQDMVYVFQEWGDDSNVADFNRLVAVFFLMCVSLSVLNYHFNMDTINPGAFMFIVFIIILMGSMVGGTDSQGFFYFNNLANEDKIGEQGATFINNYILAFFCMIISVSYWINVNRQAQR